MQNQDDVDNIINPVQIDNVSAITDQIDNVSAITDQIDNFSAITDPFQTLTNHSNSTISGSTVSANNDANNEANIFYISKHDHNQYVTSKQMLYLVFQWLYEHNYVDKNWRPINAAITISIMISASLVFMQANYMQANMTEIYELPENVLNVIQKIYIDPEMTYFLRYYFNIIINVYEIEIINVNQLTLAFNLFLLQNGYLNTNHVPTNGMSKDQMTQLVMYYLQIFNLRNMDNTQITELPVKILNFIDMLYN